MKYTSPNKYVWQVFIALIPIPFTIWLTVQFVKDHVDVRQLEYRISANDGFIRLPDNVASQIEILHNEQQIKNLSSVSCKLFNRTGKNYDDVKIFFSFPTNQASLISTRIRGPKDYPLQGFKDLSSADPGTVGWLIETLNASENYDEYFEIELIFLGEESPKVKLSLLKSGLGLAVWDPFREPIGQKILPIAAGVLGILLYFSLLVVMLRLQRGRKWKFRRKLASDITSYFNSLPTDEEKPSDEQKRKRVIQIYMNTRHECRDYIERVVFGFLEKLQGKKDENEPN